MIQTTNLTTNQPLNVFAYFVPDIYSDDSDITIDDLNFIPGIITSKSDDDEEDPIYYDENMKLISSIEQFTAEQFQKALTTLQPILKNAQFNYVQINIDIFSLFSSDKAVASYNPNLSNMLKGSYVFLANYFLIWKYIQLMQTGKQLSLNEDTIWIHEIIHLLDHNAVMQSMAYKNVHTEAEAAKYHLLNFRNEGIASLYYFLKNDANSIKSLEQAKTEFSQYFDTEMEEFKKLNVSEGISMKANHNSDLWYEVGPWLILDLFCIEFDSVCEELIERIIYSLENQIQMNEADILEIIQWSLHISPERFIDYGFDVLKPVYALN